jgi:hypothetical protein
MMRRENIRFNCGIILTCGLVALVCLGIDSAVQMLEPKIGFKVITLPLVAPFATTAMIGASKAKHFTALQFKWLFISLFGNILGGAVGLLGAVLSRSIAGFALMTLALAVNFYFFYPFEKMTRTLGVAKEP